MHGGGAPGEIIKVKKCRLDRDSRAGDPEVQTSERGGRGLEPGGLPCQNAQKNAELAGGGCGKGLTGGVDEI